MTPSLESIAQVPCERCNHKCATRPSLRSKWGVARSSARSTRGVLLPESIAEAPKPTNRSKKFAMSTYISCNPASDIISGGATADCVRDEWCEFERRGQTHSSIRQGMPCTLRSCSAGATLDGAVLTIICDGAVWGVGPEQGCVLLRLVDLASSAA